MSTPPAGRRLRWRRPGLGRPLLQVGVDAAAWAVALTVAAVTRFDFDLAAVHGRGLLVVVALAALTQAVAGAATGLYRGKRRYGSLDEVAVLVPATIATTLVLLVAVLWRGQPRLVPLSVPLLAGALAIVLIGAARYAWRLRADRLRRPSGDVAAPVLVFGAGDAGAQLVAAMLRDPTSPYLPVALLDDSPTKRRLRILGVPVVGGRHDLARAAATYDASVVVIAISSADATLIGEITDLANDGGLHVRVLPPTAELLDGRVGLDDVRQLTEADLLGRHEVDTDVAEIAGYLTGRRVLVTGAGGSIGSELCRQIARYAPAQLLKLDRDESALHAVQLSIDGRALLDSDDTVLLDIRDRAALDAVFREHRPEVVFHAAALKHLPLLERFPGEGARTNCIGTLDLLEVSVRYGVDRFVNISTDKAADPISVLGYTKRIAERLTAAVARRADGTYLSVRFGNVLGSRGSVLTTFRRQLAEGGPITVTHPDVTRYFMTVEEAVQLVIQSGAIASPGEALVLDMGEPVRIASVAERLSAQDDRDIAIVYTGLRPGEKMHEVLLGADEVDVRPVHPLITHALVPPCEAAEVRRLDCHGDPTALVDELVRLSYGSAVGPRPGTAGSWRR